MSIFSSDSGLGVLAAIRQNEKLDGIPTAVVTSPAARRIIVKSKKAGKPFVDAMTAAVLKMIPAAPKD